MSQADLAEAMSSRGVPGMHPQTITKLEAGTRSLKYLEAVELADALGLRFMDGLGSATSESASIARRARDMYEVHVALVDSIVAYLKAFDDLAAAVAVLGDKAPTIPHTAVGWLRESLRWHLFGAWREAERKFAIEGLDSFDTDVRDQVRRQSLDAMEGWRLMALSKIEAKRQETSAKLAEVEVEDDGEHQEAP